MALSKKNITLEACIYGPNVKNMFTVKIPLGISGTEMINYMMFQYSLEITPDYIVIASIPNPSNPQLRLYYIIDSTNDFQKVADYKGLVLVLYPPKIVVNIHAPDGHVAFREYESRKSCSDIVSLLCHSSFKLQNSIAYSIYLLTTKGLMFPVSPNRCLIECNPFVTDIFLKRRFWMKSVFKCDRESDVVFNFAQAKDIVYNKHFDYKNYHFIDMIAINLVVTYRTYEAAKKAIKKTKRKNLITIFPKYVVKSRKNMKKCAKEMNTYEGRPVIDLKRIFLNFCLDNTFFGVVKYPVICSAPLKPNDPKKPHIITINDEYVFLLESKVQVVIAKIQIERIMRWRMISNEELIFYCLDEQLVQGHRKVIEWHIRTNQLLSFIDYFNCLVNVVKYQMLHNARKKDHKENNKKHRRRSHSVMSRSKSMSNFSKGLGGFGDNDMDLTDIDMHHEIELSNRVTLRRMDHPKPQDTPFLNALINPIDSNAEDTVKLLRTFYSTELGFSYQTNTAKKPENVDINVFITEACKIVDKTIKKTATISDTTVFFQENLPESIFRQNIIGWQLQGNSDSLFDRVSVVARSISYFIYSQEISPLDAFVSLNYIHSLVLMFAKKQWKTIDFSGIADQIGSTFAVIVHSYLTIVHRPTHPLTTALLECSTEIMPEYIPMLNLNETVSQLLLLACLTVAKACCAVGIGSDILQPILNSLPEVISLDLALAVSLNTKLWPIVQAINNNEKAQNALLSQKHSAQIQFSSIYSIVSELNSLASFHQSPICNFILLRSPRLVTIPASPPSSVVEAAYIYQIARELSLILWYFGDKKYQALSQEVSWHASCFYNEFIEAVKDNSLTIFVDKYYRKILNDIQQCAIIFFDTQSISSILPTSDPVYNIICNLLNSSEDTRTTISLLCLDSAQRKHRIKVLTDSYVTIDNQLINEKIDLSVLDSAYRVFSTMAIGLNKDNEDLPVLLSELGFELINFAKVEKTEENCQSLKLQVKGYRDKLKAYSFVPEERFLELTGFDDIDTNEVVQDRPAPGEIQVALKSHSSRASVELLHKIANVLRKF